MTQLGARRSHHTTLMTAFGDSQCESLPSLDHTSSYKALYNAYRLLLDSLKHDPFVLIGSSHGNTALKAKPSPLSLRESVSRLPNPVPSAC